MSKALELCEEVIKHGNKYPPSVNHGVILARMLKVALTQLICICDGGYECGPCDALKEIDRIAEGGE